MSAKGTAARCPTLTQFVEDLLVGFSNLDEGDGVAAEIRMSALALVL